MPCSASRSASLSSRNLRMYSAAPVQTLPHPLMSFAAISSAARSSRSAMSIWALIVLSGVLLLAVEGGAEGGERKPLGEPAVAAQEPLPVGAAVVEARLVDREAEVAAPSVG